VLPTRVGMVRQSGRCRFEVQEKLVAGLVADGLSIQDKSLPEPLHKQTGKGHYASQTVAEINQGKKANRSKGKPCSAPGYNPCASHIFPERGHSCPPVGYGVGQRAKVDKNVRAPITRANNVGRM
jgi:hypothetical protein